VLARREYARQLGHVIRLVSPRIFTVCVMRNWLVDGPGNVWEILGNGNVARATELSWAPQLVLARAFRSDCMGKAAITHTNSYLSGRRGP